MKKAIRNLLLGLAILPFSVLAPNGNAQASLAVTQWFFGNWDCTIDGRPAKMQWRVVDDTQVNCNGDVCSSSSGVKVVGRFSDNGSAWVPLATRYSNRTDLGIRYLGREQDNWFLRFEPRGQSASGWTTWRGNRYPLMCRKLAR
ncbi:hypothetical protein NIES4101_50230 [Calothrix sp. NIES-4101]|nr:hypothetical protein NIES4101_50230 [Calothrix sp. NIES-4101]